MNVHKILKIKQSAYLDNYKDTVLLNLKFSPSCRKTSTLTKIRPKLKDEMCISVMEGELI